MLGVGLNLRYGLIVSKDLVAIVTPVFNDWESVQELIKRFAANVGRDKSFSFVIVNDGSTESPPDAKKLAQLGVPTEVLTMQMNVGHQRAIGFGISHVLATTGATHVVVMDSDGEDSPESIPKLLNELASHPEAAVVASRGRRFDSPKFKAFYGLHRFFFRVATGYTLDYGNFFAISARQARKLIQMPEVRLHVGSALLKSKIPLVRVRVDRGRRYKGQSKMSFEALVGHSLASLANFSEQIFIRLLALAALVTALTIPLVAAVIIWRLMYDQVTPGWATSAVGFLVVVTVQVWTFLGLGAMFTMSNKALLTSDSSHGGNEPQSDANKDLPRGYSEGNGEQ